MSQGGKTRVALVGFDTATNDGLSAAGVNVVAHIFANPENKYGNFPDKPHLTNFHHWKRYASRAKPAPRELLSIRETLKAACFQDFIRCTDRWDWSRELVYNWNDYDHLFAIAFDDACNWLLTHNPDVVVYSNVPHQGMAVVNYHTARAMGKKTKVFIQSPFEGRSWLVDHWQDLGDFSSSTSGMPFEIDVSRPAAPPFYMNKVRGDTRRKVNAFAHKLRARTIVGLGLTGISKRLRRRNFQRNMGRWQRAVEDQRYLKNSANFFKDNPIKDPYVYFPLHLQPEMTTDILGGKYADQVLALEELRNLVPDHIAIYVKENPKQSGRLRSEAFFERISKLPNTKFLSRKVPSFALSENAVAVATITGTVGWEALRLGKPAIVFGKTYWNDLPGAFKFENRLDWSEIEKFKFDLRKFKDAVDRLSCHAHPGICDPAYAVLQKDYKPDENAKNLAITLITKGGV